MILSYGAPGVKSTHTSESVQEMTANPLRDRFFLGIFNKISNKAVAE